MDFENYFTGMFLGDRLPELLKLFSQLSKMVAERKTEKSTNINKDDFCVTHDFKYQRRKYLNLKTA